MVSDMQSVSCWSTVTQWVFFSNVPKTTFLEFYRIFMQLSLLRRKRHKIERTLLLVGSIFTSFPGYPWKELTPDTQLYSKGWSSSRTGLVCLAWCLVHREDSIDLSYYYRYSYYILLSTLLIVLPA